MRKMAIILTLLNILTIHGFAEEVDPNQIFEKVRDTYKSMETYKSEGTVTVTIDQENRKETATTEFSILLKKPNFYRIVWNEKNDLTPQQVQSGAVWNDGTQPYLYNTNSYHKVSSDLMALASATGISGGAANTVPSFFSPFFYDRPDLFAHLKNVKLEGSEKIGDDECYVISGSSSYSIKETFWISKSKKLIVKFWRSLEVPEGENKSLQLSDDQIAKAIKADGKEVNEENIKDMRAKMDMIKAFMNVKVKGEAEEIHTPILSPKLELSNFKFAIPEGAVLKQ